MAVVVVGRFIASGLTVRNSSGGNKFVLSRRINSCSISREIVRLNHTRLPALGIQS
jgi:hypothetical protein